MFEPDAEAMPHEELARLQDDRLRTLVGRLLALGGIQAQRLRAAGVTSPADVALADLPGDAQGVIDRRNLEMFVREQLLRW